MSEHHDPVGFADFEINWPGPEHDLTAVGKNPQTIFFFDWQRNRRFALHGRLMGYRKAAKLLAEQVIERGHVDELDTVFFAYAFIWRHYMELQLKSLVVTYRVLLDKKKKDELRHGLWPLWQQLYELMREAEDDVSDPAVKATGRLLKQFHDLDPTSQEFRYDVRTDGSPTLEAVTNLDYGSFHCGLDAVANFLEGVDSSVDEKLDFKRELRAEYDAVMADMYDQYNY